MGSGGFYLQLKMSNKVLLFMLVPSPKISFFVNNLNRLPFFTFLLFILSLNSVFKDVIAHSKVEFTTEPVLNGELSTQIEAQ